MAEVRAEQEVTLVRVDDGGDGRGILSTEIKYGTSDSASTQPSSWSSTVPTSIEAGKWLWVRTVINYTDNTSDTTYQKSYVGTDGKDGKSVYIQSATKSGNTTTVVIADSDGNTNTLTIVDGEDGSDGTPGASGYVHTAWANSADGTTDFSTTVSAGKKYLGVYTDQTQADSTRPADYSWSLIKGDKGDDGKDAYTVILTNESHTFAGSTSAALAGSTTCNIVAYKGATQMAATIGTITGQPTGMTTSITSNGTTSAYFTVTVTTSMTTKNGVLTVPVTVDGKSFSMKFTYSLALKGDQGEQGDKGEQGADSGNMLLDVYAPSVTKVNAKYGRYFSDASNTSTVCSFVPAGDEVLPDPNAKYFVRIKNTELNKYRALCFYGSANYENVSGMVVGDTYKVSCWVRQLEGSSNFAIGNGGAVTNLNYTDMTFVPTAEWQRYEKVFTFSELNKTTSTGWSRLYFINLAGTGINGAGTGIGQIDMCGFKLERINAITASGRNLCLRTVDYKGWSKNNGTTFEGNVITYPTVTANTGREAYQNNNVPYSTVRNQKVTVTYKIKGTSGEINESFVCLGLVPSSTSNARTKYVNKYSYTVATGEWQTVAFSAYVNDSSFSSGSGTPDFENSYFNIRVGAASTTNGRNGFQIKEVMVALGSDPCAWSPAPEDERDARKLLIREVTSGSTQGIEVGYENGSYKAFINAAGSFDVVDASNNVIASFGTEVAMKSARESHIDEMGNGYYSQNFMNIKSGEIQLKRVIDGSAGIYDGTYISGLTAEGVKPSGTNTFVLHDGVYGEEHTNLWYSTDNVGTDGLLGECFVAGWVTGGSKELMFTIPLAAPVANNYDVEATSLLITVRQNNKYLAGSAAGGKEIVGASDTDDLEVFQCPSGINVHYYRTSAFSGATNNETCGIKVEYQFGIVENQ